MIEHGKDISFPTTVRGWERVLTENLLYADGSETDSIRSFEITPETLARFCGYGPEYADDAENAFRRALQKYQFLEDRLQGIVQPLKNGLDNLPDCLAFLALSLLVDSHLDGDYQEMGEYRPKLAQWLGLNRKIQNLSGIAAMWKHLVAWLDMRVAGGEHYRRLILPDIPKNWVQIGYTRYLSFPTRRDITVLKKWHSHRRHKSRDPAIMFWDLHAFLSENEVSYGLRTAFLEFKKAMLAGAASVDHRFWRLVKRVQELSGQKEVPEVRLRLEFDFDERRQFELWIGEVEQDIHLADIGSALRNAALQQSPNLGAAARRGVLYFRPVGLASWEASGNVPLGHRGLFLAVSSENYSRNLTGWIDTFEKSGNWYLSRKPISDAPLNEINKCLQLNSSAQTVQKIALQDGVRVGKFWLGLPRYLPVVMGSNGKIVVKAANETVTSNLICQDSVLAADGPLDGSFFINDANGFWSRRATFVSRAIIHPELTGKNYELAVQQEWSETQKAALATTQNAVDWNELPYRFQDMVEAIYARAKSGLSESDTIALIGRVSGRQSWQLLRALQESSFLDVRLRARWRGRIVTLRSPTLMQVKIAGAPCIVTAGAIPQQLEDEFRSAVISQAGTPFRHISKGSCAPALIGASNVDPNNIAKVLGWELNSTVDFPQKCPVSSLSETSLIGANYVVASRWDWSLGRFSTRPVPENRVSLVRMVHPEGRDHDIYRVNGKHCRSFFSRYSAIMDAHQQAGVPMFRYIDGRIQRICNEGALPVEIARVMRVKSLGNGGLVEDRWEYAAGNDLVHWLDDLLPGIIEGGAAHFSDPARYCLRGRGARRLLWNEGELSDEFR